MSTQEINLAAVVPGLAKDLVIEERPIPVPGPDEVLIRNHAIGINPIDWKRQAFGFNSPTYPLVIGADVSGIIVAAGSSVTTFKPGDRVISYPNGFVSGNNDNGAYQTYTASLARTTVHLLPKWSFAEGATIPSATATATMALFDSLKLLPPTISGSGTLSTIKKHTGILIWGGAAGTGSMVLQMAAAMEFKVFAAASEKHHALLRSMGASVLVDYRSPTAVNDLVAVAKESGVQISIAVDVVSGAKSLKPVTEVLQRAGHPDIKGRVAHTLPWPEQALPIPTNLDTALISSEDMWTRRRDLGDWLFAEDGALSHWLARGAISPRAHRVIGKGVSNFQPALDELKKGVSGEKLIVEI